MYDQPSTRLFFRRGSKQIKAQIVPHDARQQLAFCIIAVFGILLRRVLTYIDGGPRRLPKRIHTSLLVQDFGDVTALYRDCNSYLIVFDLRCWKIAKKGHLTLQVSLGEEKVPFSSRGANQKLSRRAS